ncbi:MULTISPECIES: hypothetical protein [unclassified Colwellia]|uniref:hypothetical protein n=1 Tax=unclassified Colwellia TaxID=196834 RepID=UPI0015F6B204|nr:MULTISPECIES: hypothetical protein [unclassified Colwellia]MBA6231991.1 hypothetical protein [Colwellia sp. MB02u-7]MBA6235650.1 hypothetical protein [Colwellia sp. MB02u-11]MBA6297888.1 hypothetical protein [Colwellia sp. MB3u-22]MBA6309436.1 hypothetical protein [Colwellia sp. MB3u-64]
MKFRFIGTLLFSVISFGCLATAQIPDAIEISDVKYSLNTNPLEKYLTEVKWEKPENASISSANWRGYLAVWKVEAGNLLLTDMTISVPSETEKHRYDNVSILKSVFPNQKEILAAWYSGALIVPYGEMTNYVHMGYGSSYESYIVLRINNGVVIEHLVMVAAEFEKYKHRKFQTFKETKKFQDDLKNLMGGEYNWTEEQALSFMQSFHAEYYLSL